MIEHRHFFVVDGTARVGVFDSNNQRVRDQIERRASELGFEIEPIRIPEHAGGREQAIRKMSEATVGWDERLRQ